MVLKFSKVLNASEIFRGINCFFENSQRLNGSENFQMLSKFSKVLNAF